MRYVKNVFALFANPKAEYYPAMLKISDMYEKPASLT